MVEWIQQTEGIWQYIVLFLVSLVPSFDVFYIIPVGVVLGMSPIAVGVISFVGNFIMVVIFAVFFEKIANWYKKRKEKKGKLEPSRSEKRAKVIWEKYGLPTFALVSPSLLGTDLAALAALLFGSTKTKVIVWMGVSLIIWSVLMTVASVYGFQSLNWI